MAAKTGSIQDRGDPKFTITADGSLSNAKAERLALFVADDVAATTAWEKLGGRANGGSYQYRRRIESYQPYVDRLAMLRAEKETFMADELFGEAKWMIRQMWREARVTANATMMQKAAEMWMKLVERESDRNPVEGAAGGGVNTKGRPGAPSVENPQTSGGMSEIKRKLMAAGAPVPGQVLAAEPTPAPVHIIAPADQPDDGFQPDIDFDAQMARLLPA